MAVTIAALMGKAALAKVARRLPCCYWIPEEVLLDGQEAEADCKMLGRPLQIPLQSILPRDPSPRKSPLYLSTGHFCLDIHIS
jgi:hypothetical protein